MTKKRLKRERECEDSREPKEQGESRESGGSSDNSYVDEAYTHTCVMEGSEGWKAVHDALEGSLNGDWSFSTNRFSVGELIEKLEVGVFRNARLHRGGSFGAQDQGAIWNNARQQSFVHDFVHGHVLFAPMIAHKHSHGDSNHEPVYDIYDGNNRLVALAKFLTGELAVCHNGKPCFSEQVPEAVMDLVKEQSVDCWVFEHCDEKAMCRIARSLNSGWHMSVGEKVNFARAWDTPATTLLNELAQCAPWCNDTLLGTRSEGVKFAVEVMMNIELHGSNTRKFAFGRECKSLEHFLQRRENLANKEEIVECFELLDKAISRMPNVHERQKCKCLEMLQCSLPDRLVTLDWDKLELRI